MSKEEIIHQLMCQIPGLIYAKDLPVPVKDADLLPNLPDDEFDGF